MDLRTKFRWDRATPVRIAGVSLVIISMFLKVLGGNVPMRGYECAYYSLGWFFGGLFEFIPTPFARQLHDAAFRVFVGASGLTNPLLLLYLFFKPTWRIPVVTIFAILVAEAVSVFIVFRTIPGLGFFMWVVGIVLIVAPPYNRSPVAAKILAPVA